MDLSEADSVQGKVKEGVGSISGDERLEAEGRAQSAAGSIKGRVAGRLDEVGGSVKQFAGGLLGDDQMQAESQAQKVIGRVRTLVAKNPAAAAAGAGVLLLVLMRLIRR